MIPTWPATRVGEALEAIAKRSGLEPNGLLPRPRDELVDQPALLADWLEAAADWVGLEIEPLPIASAEVANILPDCGPALLRLKDQTFVALTEDGEILGPDYSVHRADTSALVSALTHEPGAHAADAVDACLERVGVPRRRRSMARLAVLDKCVSDRWIEGCWSLRTPADNSWRTFRAAGLFGRLTTLVAAHASEYALWIGSWWLLGLGALEGRLDTGWLLAWVLILATLIPLHAVGAWLEGVIAISAGGLLKERLLAGALRLDSDELRHRGSGELLGRVIESEALESLALGGGFAALVAIIELAFAVFVIALGAGAMTQVIFLCLWTALTLLLAWRYFRATREWTAGRLRMTQDLVERLVGHRTRLAQEDRDHWHEAEDQALEGYMHLSRKTDAAATWLSGLIPAGWLIGSILVLANPFVFGSASTLELALGIGGTLLAHQAFDGLTNGLWSVAGAAIAWGKVRPVFQAASRSRTRRSPDVSLHPTRKPKEVLVDAQDLVFRYEGRTEPVLRGCDLRIAEGDRILLEGPSGSGKSTLAALLAGLRRPSSGLLLAGGLDQASLGLDGWRQIVACAPQFHENHVFSGTLAFNLLMGRGAFFSDSDVEEAEAICRELGLEELLSRMPGGVMQIVGENGWQLSHGERSRLFVARALLQRAEVVVLDEGFAALDSRNLRLTLDCIRKRARAALVIAHR